MYRERERVWVNETNIDHVIWKKIKKQQKLKKKSLRGLSVLCSNSRFLDFLVVIHVFKKNQIVWRRFYHACINLFLVYDCVINTFTPRLYA